MKDLNEVKSGEGKIQEGQRMVTRSKGEFIV